MPRRSPPDRLAAAAYHEAGHAVMCRLMHLRVGAIRIGLDAAGGGETMHENPFRHRGASRRAAGPTRLQVEKAVMLCLAGPMAQRKYEAPVGARDDGGALDLDTALGVAMRFFRSKRTADAYLAFARAWVAQKFDEPMVWAAVENLARALMRQRTISGRKAAAIVRGAVENRARDAV